MKFVFFVHYFPPLNSTGSRRVESFAKYLVRKGHEVVVVSTHKTPRDGPLTEAVPTGVRLYEIESSGRLARSEMFVVPCTSIAKRIHWTRRLKQRLMRYFGQVLDHRIVFAFALRSKRLDSRVVGELSTADIFVSSCPPWPSHLAALFAQRRFGKPWIADYRDQFSSNHIMNGGWLSDKVELCIDRALLKRANAVTVISGPMQTYYEAFHPVVKCIENGYDSEVFDKIRMDISMKPPRESDSPIVIRYMGTITRDRIPHGLLTALEILTADTATKAGRMKFEFFGETRILEKYIVTHCPHLSEWFVFLPAVPYLQSLQAMLTADALLFVETSDVSSLSARGVLTTKLFEYLASRRLILAEIDEATLAATYIRRASQQHVVTRDPASLASTLRRLARDQHVTVNEAFVSSLSRKEKAHEFEKLAIQLAHRLPERAGKWKDYSEHC